MFSMIVTRKSRARFHPRRGSDSLRLTYARCFRTRHFFGFYATSLVTTLQRLSRAGVVEATAEKSRVSCVRGRTAALAHAQMPASAV